MLFRAAGGRDTAEPATSIDGVLERMYAIDDALSRHDGVAHFNLLGARESPSKGGSRFRKDSRFITSRVSAAHEMEEKSDAEAVRFTAEPARRAS
jgi:hypothetical protein